MSSEGSAEALLADYPVTISVPVAWGEMDAYGHVNNVVYLRWFESARIAYLIAIGFRGGAESGHIGPILHSTHCRFRQPLQFPDTVHVGARVTSTGDDRFDMEYRLVSESLGRVAADGGGLIVAFDYANGRKTVLPDTVRKAIAKLERQMPRDETAFDAPRP